MAWKTRALALGVTAVLFAGFGLAIDPDGDGVSNARELMLGTSGVSEDSDRDGLTDADEWRRGLNPLDADMDADGVLDGDERALVCVLRRDCDGDGLPDGDEQDRFDALDPDTFDVGLADGVVQVFEADGQPASRDDDRDGIPDGWEGTQGRIDWGAFEPAPGQTDLLVEFLRVEGPQSGQYNLNFDPAYAAVVDMFAAQGIRLQWIETVVATPTELRPGFLDTDTVGYYDGILRQGASSLNPFVTTLVLNPQQTQADLGGDILGAAFLRSMIATVDYGAHTQVDFVQDRAEGLQVSGAVTLSPVLESHIIGARPEQAELLGFNTAGIVELCASPCSDDFWFVTRQEQENQPPLFLRWTWEPDWFATAPNITTEDGRYLQLRRDAVQVNQENLAGTIAHELGHTFGLCHAHDAECYEKFQPGDINQPALESTTMSYWSPQGTLHFLASEWLQLETYITCPPQEPLVLIASGASDADVLDAKYLRSFTEASEARACGDSAPVAATLPRSAAGDSNPAVWLSVYGLATVGALVFVALRR